MNQPTASCANDQRMREFLEAPVDSTCDPSLEEHLSQCPICSGRLEALAAEEQFWTATASSLKSDDFDLDTNSSTAIWKPLSRVLQSLLGPSEDPHSLGRVGRFEIVGVVGSGGMGTVLKARDVDIDRIVALKLPAAHLLDSPSALERIEREARSAATIRHPGIIEIYQVERWREIPYLVMPFHKGPSLNKRIESEGAMTLLESIRIARQTAEALAAAHDHGVVHRDVKPGNILLGQGTERAVLTDFGIAKIQSDGDMTATGVIVGTPAFLSPEQAGGGEATPQSDLFCLGSVLWTMLAGRPPFVNQPTHAIVTSIATDAMPRLSDFRTGLAPWVYRLVGWLHQHPSEQRPRSAHHCAELLRGCEQHLTDPIQHPLPVSLREPSRALRRGKWGIAILALLLLAYAVVNPGVAPRSEPTPNVAKLSNQAAMTVQPDPPDTTIPSAGVVPPTSIDQLSESLDQIDQEVQALLKQLDRMSPAIQSEYDPPAEQSR